MPNTTQLEKHTVIISTWAPPMIGGPSLFYNLYSQFPASSYHLITNSRSLRTGIDPATWLTGEYIFYDALFKTKDEVEKGFIKNLNSAPTEKLSVYFRVISFINKIPVLAQVLELAAIIKSCVLFVRAFKKVPRKYPLQLLGLSDSGSALLATYFISRKYHLPYCYYMLDLYRGNRLPLMSRLIARFTERLIFTRAEFVIVNNKGTVDYYQKKYGNAVRIHIIHNSVFPEKYECERLPYTTKPPFEIVFTGSIGWPQKESIHNLLKAADLLADLPLTIVLYCNSRPSSIVKAAARRPNVKITYAPYSDMPKIQARASLLLLPLSWNTKGVDIISTATPGKLTDYLASGRPILIHAPEYAYISRYGKEKGIGLVVDNDDFKLLAKTIRNFYNNPEIGRVYIQNALNEFYLNNDARKNAKKLTEILNMV